MDTRRILSELRAERDRLNQAIDALQSLDRTAVAPVRRGRGKRATAAKPAARGRRGRRRLSAATRKRMSEMMKARWAERKRRQGKG